jgi:hypothetical protein
VSIKLPGDDDMTTAWRPRRRTFSRHKSESFVPCPHTSRNILRYVSKASEGFGLSGYAHSRLRPPTFTFEERGHLPVFLL